MARSSTPISEIYQSRQSAPDEDVTGRNRSCFPIPSPVARGLRKAAGEAWSKTREQRHRVKSQQHGARRMRWVSRRKRMSQEIKMAEAEAAAELALTQRGPDLA